MSAHGPTFITKIQVAPDTDTWEKPEYKAEDTQYFDAKYHDWAEVDAAVSCLLRIARTIVIGAAVAAIDSSESVRCRGNGISIG